MSTVTALAGQVCRTRAGRGLVLALCLMGAALPAAAQDRGGCGPPPPWREGAGRGHPMMEVAACLRDQAYETRTLGVPAQSAAAGIVAQCEIRVDRFEGEKGMGFQGDADRHVMEMAAADVAHYRQCVGR